MREATVRCKGDLRRLGWQRFRRDAVCDHGSGRRVRSVTMKETAGRNGENALLWLEMWSEGLVIILIEGERDLSY